MLFIESPPAAQNKSQLEERIAAPESKRMWPQVQAAMMNARPPTSIKQDLQVEGLNRKSCLRDQDQILQVLGVLFVRLSNLGLHRV